METVMVKTAQNTATVMQFPIPTPEVMRRIRAEINSLPDSKAKKDMEKAWSKAVLSLASEYPEDF